MAPGIILGGIYWGICTPTEAAVIAVLYSLFTGVVIYRELTFAKIYEAFVETLTVNGATTFMVGLSMAFASYLLMAGLPQQIAYSSFSPKVAFRTPSADIKYSFARQKSPFRNSKAAIVLFAAAR